MATKQIAWNTGSGNITLTYQGQGDGTISIQSDANNGSARSQVITVETVGGAITKNLTVSQAACPIPVGTVLSYSYTGIYQEVTLPAGQYKLQCWGAQGGSNAAASSYNITAKAGGKGGYSEGVITLSLPTTVRVYVGGEGSSSAGGFNGGGSTTGSSTYNASNEQGVSRMGGGGGATDIRLSDGALLSRMIVAGGGSGGAMCYKKAITETEETVPNNWFAGSFNYNKDPVTYYSTATTFATIVIGNITNVKTLKLSTSGNFVFYAGYLQNSSQSERQADIYKLPTINGSYSIDIASYVSSAISAGKSPYYLKVSVMNTSGTAFSNYADINLKKVVSTSSTSNESQVGGVGGGTQGGAYSSTYAGKQNAAGSGGSFGQGANMTTTNYRYCSGAGGGGWYGGGTTYSDSSPTYCKYGGGGSGFVNTASSAGNRPSGYTGLELDSGTTYAGNTSFPNTAGTGNETGHSGNGYAKITRLS